MRQRMRVSAAILRAALGGVVLALAACRTVPAPHPERAWELVRPDLQSLRHFELRGHVAVRAGQDGFIAGLRWVQDGPQAQLALQGPLGVGSVQVSSDGRALEVRTSHGERLDDAAARADLLARLGFEPPLASLRYWLLGVPDPAVPASEGLDPGTQRLAHLQQGDWQIDYGDYVTAGGHSLPSRVTLQSAGVRVRLVIDQWSGIGS